MLTRTDIFIKAEDTLFSISGNIWGLNQYKDDVLPV